MKPLTEEQSNKIIDYLSDAYSWEDVVDWLKGKTIKPGHCRHCGLRTHVSGWCGECYSWSGYIKEGDR